MRVGQLDITHGSGELYNLSRHAFISFRSKARRPFHRGVSAYFFLPFRTHVTQEIGEDVAGPAAVGSVDHDEVGIRQLDARIEHSEFFVIPPGNLSEKNFRDGRAVEL